MNFISDDEIGYEDENFYPIEYDDDVDYVDYVDYVGDVDDIDDIDDFDYNPLDHFSEILLSNLKKGEEEEFKNIFSTFPDYKIEIAELSMVGSSKVFVYSLVNNIPVVFVATVSNKKIKCWEVFQYGKLS